MNRVYSVEEYNASPEGTEFHHFSLGKGVIVVSCENKYLKFGGLLYPVSHIHSGHQVAHSMFPLNDPMRMEVKDSQLGFKLLNLYVHNAILYAKSIRYGLPAKNPDEQLMRMIESRVGIKELDVIWWRNQVFDHFIQLRIDACIQRLTPAINWMLMFPETIEKLSKYAAIIPGYAGYVVVDTESQIEEVQEST